MQVVVIGLGLFGAAVAETLVKSGQEVLAIDTSEDVVQQTVDQGILTHAACVDATLRSNLERLGVGKDYDVGVIAIGTRIEASIVATIHLKDLGVRKVVAKALNATHAKILSKVGADKVLIPEVLSGESTARNLLNPSVLEELRFSDDFSILECLAPPALTGKSLAESDLRATFGVNVFGYKRGGTASFEVPPSFVIEPGDVLIVGVSKRHRERFLKLTEAARA